MSYTRLRYHIVTATCDREPIISEAIESKLYGIMRTRAIEVGGAIIAVGGTETPIHLVSAIPPSLSVAKFVQAVKATSSRVINKSDLLEDEFQWLPGYGAFTINPSKLAPVIRYVENQKQHHGEETLQPSLEQIS